MRYVDGFYTITSIFHVDGIYGGGGWALYNINILRVDRIEMHLYWGVEILWEAKGLPYKVSPSKRRLQ